MKRDDYSITNTIFFLIYLVGGIYASILYFFGSEHPTFGLLRPKGDYLVYLVECFGLISLVYLPKLFSKQFHIILPNYFLIVLNSFIIGCLLLGGMLNFYTFFPPWDSFLHFMSGIVLVILCMAVIEQLNPPLNIGFMVFVSICFAITSGVVWEILEYFLDEITGSNSQSYKDTAGQIMVGHNALKDSMIDLILEFAASLIAGIVYYKKKKIVSQKVEE